MKTLFLSTAALACLVAADAFAQSRTPVRGDCQFFDGAPLAGFNGAMEGGPGTTVPGPDPNASVTASGFSRGFQNSECSATIGLVEVGKTEPGGPRARTRIQNSDGPPGGS